MVERRVLTKIENRVVASAMHECLLTLLPSTAMPGRSGAKRPCVGGKVFLRVDDHRSAASAATGFDLLENELELSLLAGWDVELQNVAVV